MVPSELRKRSVLSLKYGLLDWNEFDEWKDRNSKNCTKALMEPGLASCVRIRLLKFGNSLDQVCSVAFLYELQ